MNDNTLLGVATAVEWNGKTIIITADDIETLKAYLHGQSHDGHPEAREVAIVLGKAVELPPIPAYYAFAARLNGREIGNEITPEEENEANDKGLVVVFGYSDDCAEFRGAIRDEVELGDIRITPKGKILDSEQLEALESLQADGLATEVAVKTITADFHPHTYKTDIPHATFDIMEDGELFCRGIVFAINDLKY